MNADANHSLTGTELPSSRGLYPNLSRLHHVDFLRGIALTIVLLDHIDWFARIRGNGLFRDWTLMGLGFSDAAEAFVFLSGFTFGWVYTTKVSENGIWRVQVRLLLRSLQIYAAYLATVAFLVLLGNFFHETFAVALPASGSGNILELKDAVIAAVFLTYQPFALGILCLYIVVLPVLPLWLALFQRCPWTAFSLSAAVYAAVQFYPHLNLPMLHGGWYFNPMAWQFLFILGIICGHRNRRGQWGASKSGACVSVAVLIILYGILIKKCPQLMSGVFSTDFHPWIISDAFAFSFPSKMNLGPLRLLHFSALAYLVTISLPNCESGWLRRATNPLALCGRNSLAIYCTGVVLAYFSAVAFHWLGATSPTILLVAADACALQFLAAYLWERRQRNRRFIVG